MATCFFCFREARLTRAHLFQDRFRKLLETPEDQVYLSSASATHGGVHRSNSFAGDIRQMKVTSLCEACNSGWMNKVELAAVPAFTDLMHGRIPAPTHGLALAQWAVLVGALSSELYPALEIPAEHRELIRRTRGQPREFSTYVVLTSEHLSSLQTDLYRLESAGDPGHMVSWLHVLHAGPFALLSATPALLGRLPRVLSEAGIQSTLGFISSNLVYVPRGLREAVSAEGDRPTHTQVQTAALAVVGDGRAPLTTAPNGIQLLDLSQGAEHRSFDTSFDFDGQLHDYRDLPGFMPP